MKIFVFEYASAGLLGATPLLTEGYAMLKSVCRGLSAAGHEVHTFLFPVEAQDTYPYLLL